MTAPFRPDPPDDLWKRVDALVREDPDATRVQPTPAQVRRFQAQQRASRPNVMRASIPMTGAESRYYQSQGALPSDLPGSSPRALTGQALQEIGLGLMAGAIGEVAKPVLKPVVRAVGARLAAARAEVPQFIPTAAQLDAELRYLMDVPEGATQGARTKLNRDEQLIDMFMERPGPSMDTRPPRTVLKEVFRSYRTRPAYRYRIGPVEGLPRLKVAGEFERGIPINPMASVDIGDINVKGTRGEIVRLFASPAGRANLQGGTRIAGADPTGLKHLLANVDVPAVEQDEFTDLLFKLYQKGVSGK